MRNVSTFGAFTTARLGIFAAQKGLEVTGNNMTNINTVGYTRQRLDQVSFVSGGTSYYATPQGTKVGNGVLTTGVSQLRDPFLDIAYRNAQANVGQEDTTLAWLEEVAGVLDEVGDGDDDNGVIYNQIQTVIDQISQMITEGAGHGEYDTLVRTAAQGLTNLFNTYAKDLEKAKERLEGSFEQDVKTVNELLKNIQEYNEQIRKADIRGDSALELRDQRNLALDQLSQYVKINVSYEMEDVGSGTMVEKLVVTLDNDNGAGHEHTLVNGMYVTELSVDDNNYYNITLDALKDKDGGIIPADPNDATANTGVTLDEDDLIGSLQGSRDMLNGTGEFATKNDIAQDPNMTTNRGIPYYQKSLDLLANKFAEVMNAANMPVDENDDPILDADGNALGGVLFSNDSNGDVATGITAANISISHSWSIGDVKLQCSANPNAASGATDNLAHILAELTAKDHEFSVTAIEPNAVATDPIFTGSLQDMFLNIESVLGNDISSTTVVLTSYATTANNLYMDRDSISGVDLNEEAANMMQYQKAYSAACRLMTTLDQALDKLINGTGTVGL